MNFISTLDSLLSPHIDIYDNDTKTHSKRAYDHALVSSHLFRHVRLL